MFSFLGKILVGVALVVGGWFGYHQQVSQPAQPALFGSTFSPTGGGTYRLQSSIGSTDTSITLSSFKEPISNILYTMNYLNSTIEFGTLDPGNTSKSEFVSFTGITQNGDGTATLTGVTRGLTRTPAGSSCVASTTLASSHSGQSIFILSDSPCLFAQYAIKSNNETITGQWTFNTFPITPSNATSSVNAAGISQLALPSQQAAGTATSTNGNGAPLVLSSQYATSTFGYNNTAANKTVVLNTNGHIDSNFIASTTGVASTTLQTDASGNLYWLTSSRLIQPLTLNTGTFTTSSTTVISATIPANAIGSSGVIHIRAWGIFDQPSSTNNVFAEIGFGSGTTTISLLPPCFNNCIADPFYLDYVMSATSASAQSSYLSLSIATTTISTNGNNPMWGPPSFMAISTPNVDSTKALPLYVILRSGSGNTTVQVNGGYVELLR